MGDKDGQASESQDNNATTKSEELLRGEEQEGGEEQEEEGELEGEGGNSIRGAAINVMSRPRTYLGSMIPHGLDGSNVGHGISIGRERQCRDH